MSGRQPLQLAGTKFTCEIGLLPGETVNGLPEYHASPHLEAGIRPSHRDGPILIPNACPDRTAAPR